MKTNVIKMIVGFCALLMLTNFTTGDEFSGLEKVVKSKRFHYQMRCTLYEDATKQNTLDQQEYSFTIWDEQMHLRTGFIEIIQSRKYCVSVIEFEKEIVLDKVAGTNNRLLPLKKLNMSLDTLLQSSVSKSVLSENEREVVYLFTYSNKNSEMEKLVLKYNKVDTRPVSIEIFYKKSYGELMGSLKKNQGKKRPVMVINFDEFKPLTTCPENEFDFSRYVNIGKKGKVVRGPESKGYKLISYIN